MYLNRRFFLFGTVSVFLVVLVVGIVALAPWVQERFLLWCLFDRQTNIAGYSEETPSNRRLWARIAPELIAIHRDTVLNDAKRGKNAPLCLESYNRRIRAWNAINTGADVLSSHNDILDKYAKEHIASGVARDDEVENYDAGRSNVVK